MATFNVSFSNTKTEEISKTQNRLINIPIKNAVTSQRHEKEEDACEEVPWFKFENFGTRWNMKDDFADPKPEFKPPDTTLCFHCSVKSSLNVR